MCITGLPQYESTKAHMPKEPDELSLKQAEVVIVMQEVDGKFTTLFFFFQKTQSGFPHTVLIVGANLSKA